MRNGLAKAGVELGENGGVIPRPTEPSDKTRYKILGKYNSKVEAEKAIGAMKQC